MLCYVCQIFIFTSAIYSGGRQAGVRGRDEGERGGRKEGGGRKREMKGGRWVVWGHHGHGLLVPALITVIRVVRGP